MSDAIQPGLFPGFDRPMGGTIRGYVPEIYCDEISPAVRATPEEWLIDLAGVPALAGCWTDKEDPRPLSDGEVVNFLRLDDFGGAVLDVEIGGGWRVSHDMPAGCVACVDDDPESACDDLDTLVECLGCDPEHSHHFRLEYYDWREFAFRFDAAGRRFVPVENQQGQ